MTKHHHRALKRPTAGEIEAARLAILPAGACGVDEAGRGALAGPLVAAAAIVPAGCEFPTLRDSKLLTPAARERLYDAITEHPDVVWATGVASVEDIERLNVLQATMKAMREALRGLRRKPTGVWVDGNYFRDETGEFAPATTVVRGDMLYPCISAASVLAKVTRDRWMRSVADQTYPIYGFARHKGYATKEHREAIARHGACPLHRKLFLRNIERERSQTAVFAQRKF